MIASVINVVVNEIQESKPVEEFKDMTPRQRTNNNNQPQTKRYNSVITMKTTKNRKATPARFYTQHNGKKTPPDKKGKTPSRRIKPIVSSSSDPE